MKRILAFLLLIGTPLWAADSVRIVGMEAFDRDGEPADADQIVTAVNGDLLDSKTFTKTADPDSCRLIDMTVTDANSSITAGVVTVVGTDCLGRTRTCTFDFAPVATRGSGVKTLSVTGRSEAGCYLSTVSSITTNALTGEGGAGVDLMTLGYTTNAGKGWAVFGKLLPPGPTGNGVVDPTSGTYVSLPITTSNTNSTTVTSVGSNSSFTDVVVNDLLEFNVDGRPETVRVTARASANSITVSRVVRIPSTGVAFTYKHLYFSTDPTDQLWYDVSGYSSASFTWSIDANANTGGIVSSLECLPTNTPSYPTAPWTQIGPGDTNCTITTPTCNVTTASGSTQTPFTKSIDLTKADFKYCRFGTQFGSLVTDGDDADAANEDINLVVVLRK